MRKALIILLISLANFTQAQTDSVLYSLQAENTVLSTKLHAIKGDKQYITSELIRTQGIARLSELLTWIDKNTFNTINGDRYNLNIAGQSTQQQQNTTLMINNQKVEMERWDAININLLGISVADIAYVEIYNTPQIINGQFCGYGAINIVTRNNFKGLTYKAIANNGNPINDPGSAKYVPGYYTPNIDKTGFLYAHSLGYYGNKYHLNASFNFQDWYSRDTLITARYLNYPQVANKNTLHAFRLGGALQIKKTLIEGGGAYSKQTEFLYRNYMLQEVPTSTTYTEGYLKLTRNFSNSRYAKINGTFNQHGFDAWVNNSNYFTPYILTSNMVNTEVGKTTFLQNNLYRKYTLGYTFNYLTYSTSNGFVAQHQPYAGVKRSLNKKTIQQLDVMLNMVNQTINPQVVFNHYKNNNVISSWHFTGAYYHTRLNQYLNQTWYNYAVNNNANNLANNYPTYLMATPTQKLTGDYFYKLNFGGGFKLTFHGGLRYSYNACYLIPNQTITPALYPVTQTQGAQGNIFGKIWGINMHYNVFNNFWFDVDYYSANNTSNQKELQQLLQNEANRKLVFSAFYKLPARFDLALRTQAISKTNWQWYNSNGILQTQQLSGVFTTDISINKKLWADKININATIRNLFNQQEFYNPMGANFNTRFMITAQVKFEQLTKKLTKP
ncbi:MAG: hypothetical protein KBG11_05140 [Bacteroidia bacterium]|nr:hypothetical protein [Bacteroidia bacterium]